MERTKSFILKISAKLRCQRSRSGSTTHVHNKGAIPNLHEQFHNTKALTIMANKLGEVLEIKAADSYIKWLVGPMIIIEVRNISKLAGFIKIPSMVEGASAKDMTAQRILYSGLSNQCRKCRRFGHHTRACNVIKTKTWEGNVQPNNPFPLSEKAARVPHTNVPHQNLAHTSNARYPPKAHNGFLAMGSGSTRTIARVHTNRPPNPPQTISTSKSPDETSKAGADEKYPTGDPQTGQAMAKPSASPSHLQDKSRLADKQPAEAECTPKTKLSFGILGASNS